MEERLNDHDARLRAAETSLAKLSAQIEPLLTLSASIASLSTQLADLKASLTGLKAQAILLGGLATFVSPIICGVILYKLIGH